VAFLGLLALMHRQARKNPGLDWHYIRYNLKAYVVHTLKLTQIGDDIGLILPREVLGRLKLEKGESVFLTETPDGYVITPYNPALDEQIQAGREIMREHHDTFRQLAK
jgi:putative addiction module antidote